MVTCLWILVFQVLDPYSLQPQSQVHCTLLVVSNCKYQQVTEQDALEGGRMGGEGERREERERGGRRGREERERGGRRGREEGGERREEGGERREEGGERREERGGRRGREEKREGFR